MKQTQRHHTLAALCDGDDDDVKDDGEDGGDDEDGDDDVKDVKDDGEDTGSSGRILMSPIGHQADLFVRCQ